MQGETSDKDAVVIGAGIVGILAAINLQDLNYRVRIVHDSDISERASYGNGGGFNLSSVVPLSVPGASWQGLKWLASAEAPLKVQPASLLASPRWYWRFYKSETLPRTIEVSRALKFLQAEWFDLLNPVLLSAGAQGLLSNQGSLAVYRNEASFVRSSLPTMLRLLNGIEMEVLVGKALRDFEPALSKDYRCGVHFKGNGFIRSNRGLLEMLEAHFVSRGGSIIRDRITDFVFRDNLLQGVRSAERVHPARKAVIAAGVRGDVLAARLGDSVLLIADRGYHVVLEKADVSPRCMISDVEQKIGVTPMNEGLRVVSTVELARLGRAPRWERVEIIKKRVCKLLPELRRNIDTLHSARWMGNRPSTPDSLPVIGLSSRSNDVVYAFGHGHGGMVQAPKTAQIVASLVHNPAGDLPIEEFSPRRFSRAYTA
jgi:D-amino-acid dehydrogenase